MEEDEKIELNISKIIKRYPFNGRSNYLIDKFYIIGYNIPTLHKILIESNEETFLKNINTVKKQNDEEKSKSTLNLQAFQLKEEPILLNEFTSDFSKDCLDFDMIKEMILPNKITLYYSEDNKDDNEYEYDEFIEYEENDNFINNNDLLKTNIVVFSSNPQAENNSKKSINGFAYIFYKKLVKKRKALDKNFSKKIISFYIPIIFSIISEYPYYSSFNMLCEQIKDLYIYPKKEVPIEIMLSNIINYTHSPLNGDVILSIKPFSFLIKENEKKEVKQKKNTNSIKEVINEEEEYNNLNNDKVKTDENVIYKKKVSEDVDENEILYKSIDVEESSKKHLKKFLKKNSQMNIEQKNMLKSQTLQRSLSPKEEAVTSENIERKKRRTCTAKNMNTYLKKNKKKLKIKPINENFDIEEHFPKIKFEFLPGYPLIQYNLAKVLFYTLSPVDIIEIFFYTFLEKDVIFFSKNLEYLSLTINSYLNLNFPLNDEKYYFINASVSYDNYINNNSPFVGSTFTTILGINDQYNSKYSNASSKLKDHLAVDLDKGEIYKVEDKNNKQGSKKNKELFSLIKKICKKELKSDKKQTILAREVSILYKKLNEINSLLVNNNEELQNDIFYKLFRNGDFLSYNVNFIKKTNIDIQEAFYRLINHLCLYFYQNLSIKTEDDDLKKNNKKTNTNANSNKKINKNEMNVIFRDDFDEDKIYTNEELYFLEELRETMKYESFVYSFVQSYSPIDLYKIPLTFTEEFLSIISRKSQILEKIKFFGIIDQLYEIRRGMAISQIDINQFFIMYYKDYKEFFDREINDINDENVLNPDLIKLKYCYDENSNKYYLKYRDFELDNNILMNHLNIMNNSDEGDENNFLRYFSDVLKNNVPKKILVIDIENIIENYSIKTHLLTGSDLCCSNIILLFSLSLNFFDSNIDVQSFLGLIFQAFTVFRKYYSYVMNMIYLLFSKNVTEKNYSKAHFYLLSYYICVNSIRNLKLVPNESLMNIMKKFNQLDLTKFHENMQNQDNLNNQDITKESKEEIFQREDINESNIFLCYNCNRNQFFKEKQIIDAINDNNSDDSIKIKIEEFKKKPRIKYNNRIQIIESELYSQTSMITQLINVYNKYIVDFDEVHVKYRLLVNYCLNILIYMRNYNEFSGKDEIKDIVEIILFLFLNKLAETENLTKTG